MKQDAPVQGDQRRAVQERADRSGRVCEQALAEPLEELAVVERKRLLLLAPLRVNVGMSTEERRECSDLVPTNEHFRLRVAEESSDISCALK